MYAGCAGKSEIPWECVPYLSALEVWSQGAIQIYVYLTLPDIHRENTVCVQRWRCVCVGVGSRDTRKWTCRPQSVCTRTCSASCNCCRWRVTPGKPRVGHLRNAKFCGCNSTSVELGCETCDKLGHSCELFVKDQLFMCQELGGSAAAIWCGTVDWKFPA